jgi:hypothetical protein
MTPAENISRREARRILRLGEAKLERLIAKGYVREIRILDRQWLKRADVERVARDGTGTAEAAE